MSDLIPREGAGSQDSGRDELPDALLTGRVSDLQALFFNGRQVNSLRNYATELVRNGIEDDDVAATLTTRYQDLRERIVRVLDIDQLADIDHHVPVCEPGASVPQVAMLADQAACWVEALHEIDAFMLSQRVHAASLESSRRKATAEWKALPPSGGTGEPAELPASPLSLRGYA